MNWEETNALPLLTGKNHLDEVSVEELQQLADDYPYFAAAHLLLSSKMKQAGHPQLQKQLYKTALYFPNEQWLRYLLLETTNQKSDNNTSSQQAADAEIKKEIYNDELPDSDIQLADVSTNDVINNKETEDNNIITLPAKEILEALPVINHIYDEPEEMPLDDEELKQQSEPLPIDESNQKIANILSEQAEAFHKPVEEKTNAVVSAEPFHTVDYFASQGIRLDGKKEENNFDKKVHKFTDWLRQMKRISPHPVDLGTEAAEENYVANIADSSNYTKEIVTESMADVLLKQGKKEKAFEIYQKLSLLYPGKNTYFAALIQQHK